MKTEIVSEILCPHCGAAHHSRRVWNANVRYTFGCKSCSGRVSFSTQSIRWLVTPALPRREESDGATVKARRPSRRRTPAQTVRMRASNVGRLSRLSRALRNLA